jgi:hypothetical protein
MMKEYTLDQWRAKAIELFGEDIKQWKFKCPCCEESQTLGEFIDAGIKNPQDKFFYSCIGRWAEGRGCDWTLGGLIQVHKTLVTPPDGNVTQVMEFSDE